MSADKHPEVTEQEELREQIEQTRAELGDTVQALSDKTDVKARVHDKVDDAKDQVHQKVETGRARAASDPTPFVVAGVAMVLVAVLVVRKRRA